MVLERLGRDVVPEVDQVAGEAARPDDVDLEDVDVGRLGGEQGLVERQSLVGVGRRRDQRHLVAGLFRTGPGAATAARLLLAERSAGDGKIGRASCRERVCQYVYISGVAVSVKPNYSALSFSP